jgi:hypothetical protein
LLAEVQENLWGTSIKAKRGLLKKIIVWVKLEEERGQVAYIFPLRDADLCPVPPGECEQQDHWAPCALRIDRLQVRQ